MGGVTESDGAVLLKAIDADGSGKSIGRNFIYGSMERQLALEEMVKRKIAQLSKQGQRN